MNRIALFAAVIGVTITLPLDAQGRGQAQRPTSRATQPESRTQRPPSAETRGRTPESTRDGGSIDIDGRGRSASKDHGPTAVPPGHWPSEGMCRVWIDGVPPGRQAPQMDCATARRRVPPNGRVLDGSARPGRERDDRRDRDARRDRDDRDRDDRDDDDDDRDDRDDDDVYDRDDRGDRRGSTWPTRRRDNDRYCVDANRDGRCDAGIGRGYPTTLPDMIGAIVYGDGRRTRDVAEWLGDGRYRVRYTDQNRDRRPERVRWLDASGVVVQEWVDANRDGRADVVNIYRAGRIIQSIGGR